MHKATKIIYPISVCFTGFLLVSPNSFAKDVSQTWLECDGNMSINLPDTKDNKSVRKLYIFEKPNKLIELDAYEGSASEVLPVDVTDIEIRYSAPYNNDISTRFVSINRSTLRIHETLAHVGRYVIRYDGRCKIIQPKPLREKQF